MVVGVFPALKLGMLFIRQISKPLAQMFVNHAKNHAVFRTYFIIPPAQFYHWAEVKAKMYMMNLGAPTKVAKLNEVMAIELGANLMGEVIIFSIAGGCLVLEYSRQAAKEAKKEEARLAQVQQFSDDIAKLYGTTLRQQMEIRRLECIVADVAKHCEVPAKVMLELQSKDSIGENMEEEKMHRKTDANVTRPTTKSDNNEQPNQSMVHRAIVYIENNVRRDRHS